MASVCDSYCKGCIYKGIINGVTPWCKYVFMEDKLRPCPAGTGCTVKMTARDLKLLKAKEKKPLTEEQRRKQAEYTKAYRERKRAEKAKEWHEKKKEREIEKRTRICKHCGKAFVLCGEHRRFCCDECARQFHLLSERERSKIRWAATQAAKKEAMEKKKEEA